MTTTSKERQIKFVSLHDGSGPGSTRFWLNQAGYKDVGTDLDAADLIVFNGGEDIATEIYNEKPITGMRIPSQCSGRDISEQEVYYDYVGQKVFLGICRGSQLLNCLNGGTLWQHVNNHNRDHSILDVITSNVYNATSTHHQMMRPNKATATVVAISNIATIKLAQGVEYSRGVKPDAEADVDTEIVYYEDSNTLCIQGHPEYIPGSKFADYCLNLIRNSHDLFEQQAA